MSLSSISQTSVYILAGIVHLIPVVGAFSRGQLERLYGIQLDPDQLELVLLLRHRAVLFAIVGLLLLAAAWREELRGIAGGLGLLSMGSYVALSVSISVQSEALTRVARIDVGLGVLLALALALHLEGS